MATKYSEACVDSHLDIKLRDNRALFSSMEDSSKLKIAGRALSAANWA